MLRLQHNHKSYFHSSRGAPGVGHSVANNLTKRIWGSRSERIRANLEFDRYMHFQDLPEFYRLPCEAGLTVITAIP